MTAASAPVAAEVQTETWTALGTTALLRYAGPPDPALREAVDAELAAIDLAASRFRCDSELSRLWDRPSGSHPISRDLHEALVLALRAAELTGGAVDPTLGAELIELGYDRDWAELDTVDPAAQITTPATVTPGAIRVTRTRRPAWTEIRLTDDPPTVTLPAGVRLDLGATAKALAADRAAAAAHRAAAHTAAHRAAAADPGPTGVLVSLGGDIALAGPAPAGGWSVHVTDDHRSGPDAPGQTIELRSGGLATSSLATRRWRAGRQVHHHILDPRTGRDVEPVWRTASVAAATCADANIASTAAIVLGERAPEWLAEQGLPARLVSAAGAVRRLNGWPE